MKSWFRNLRETNNGRGGGNRYYDGASDWSISFSASQRLIQTWKGYEEISATPSPPNRKRIVVVVDEWREAKMALLWAISHVLKSCHILTLLRIQNTHNTSCYGRLWRRNVERVREREYCCLKSMEALCKSSCPEVQVEVVIAEKDSHGSSNCEAILRWIKKLEASMVVLGQKKPSVIERCCRVFPGAKEDMAELCIANAECVTVGVRKRSHGIGGYIINSRGVKNFWLLA